MHKYTKLKDNKSTYILDVFDNGDDETLTVVFGDKRKHTDVENTPENIKKFEEQMERQMDDAIKRTPRYALSTILSTASVIATGTGAITTISGFESLQNIQTNEHLTSAALLVGVGCSVIWSIREYSRLRELSAVKYRNKNAAKLCNVTQYSHALDNSSQRIRRLFLESENPLGVLNLGEYNKRDLKKIITEINREEVMKERGITYVKTK